ncbi:DUF6691 family protein [Arenimonas sp. MALMAid1274]|uniref:DUF6691 family protein n=1 Tax=Arenimonas sp. MALMAid1274 TaxID=3411630 RepID=UPI003B9DD414
MSSARPVVFAGIAGLLFGLGLAVAGMADPEKVLAFLDVLGNWDPSLAFVMGGALAVAVPGFALVRRRGRAVCGPLQLPGKRTVDRDLLLGAVLFGVGWGLAGYCPGPALAGLGRLAPESLLVVPVMFFGFWIAGTLKR